MHLTLLHQVILLLRSFSILPLLFSSTFFFERYFSTEYAKHCHDHLGGAWTNFGGCAYEASGSTCWFSECSTIFSTTSFWWWALIFGNSSQKGRVHIVHGNRGSFCFGIRRLYLGASLMYFFLFDSWCMYFFMGCICRGRHYVLCFFYCFLFHMWHIGYWFILWDYLWYMSFIFCFVK